MEISVDVPGTPTVVTPEPKNTINRDLACIEKQIVIVFFISKSLYEKCCRCHVCVMELQGVICVVARQINQLHVCAS